MRTDHLDAARDEAAKFGCAISVQKEKHKYRCTLAYHDKTRDVFVTLYPRDHRAPENVRRDVRHAARRLRGD